MATSDILTLMEGTDLTVTRYAAGSFVDGDYVNGATSTFTALMCVQPANDRDLINQEQAQRSKRWLKGYTDTELETVITATSKKADRVSFDGKMFEVQHVEQWPGKLNHWKVLMCEVNE